MPEVGGVGVPPGGAPVLGPPGGAGPGRPAQAGEIQGVLRLGGLIQVELVQAKGAGEGILDIGGQLFRALYPEGLAEGQRLTLRVASLGPPLLLQLPDSPEAALGRMLTPPPGGLASTLPILLSQTAGEGLGPGESHRLRQLQSLLALPSSPGELSRALARLFPRSGLFHEALLARGEGAEGVKSLALRLLRSVPEGPLTRALENLLVHLEAHQARSVLDGFPVMPIALPWGGEVLQGELAVEERSGRRPDGAAAAGALRLRLEMPGLGPVEAALRWGPLGISVRLLLREQFVDAASHRMTELSEALAQGAGVRLVDLRVDSLAEGQARSGPGRVEVVA